MKILLKRSDARKVKDKYKYDSNIEKKMIVPRQAQIGWAGSKNCIT